MKKIILILLSITTFAHASVPAGIIKLNTDIFANGGEICDILIQSDGKIVLCGYTLVAAQRRWTVARLTSTGALDTSFNTVGYVQWTLSNNDSSATSMFFSSVANAIVVAGYGPTTSLDSTLVGYTVSYSVTNGSVVGTNKANFGGVFTATYVNPTGSIFVLGARSDNNFMQQLAYPSASGTQGQAFGSFSTDTKGRIIFYNSGTPPTLLGVMTCGSVSQTSQRGFIGNNLFYNDYISNRIANLAVLTYPAALFAGVDGTDAVLYKTTDSVNINPLCLITSNTATVFPYNTGGGMTFVPSDASKSKILVCGATNAMGSSDNNMEKPFISRINTSDGTLDNTYGTGGITIETSSSTTPGYWANMAAQSNDYTVVAGFSESSVDAGKRMWLVARFTTTGTLDTTFNGNIDLTGVLRDTLAPFDTALAGLILTTTIDPNGKLLAGGNYGTGSALIRYNTTGTPRNSSSGFGTNGVVYDSLVPTATINKVINAAGNGYLVAGVSNTNQFTIASYTNAGAANTDFNTTGTVREINISSSAAYDMLLNGGSLAVCGYAYSTTPVVINYNSGTGQRDASIGNNGLQQFSYLVTGTMYGITSVGTSRYGAGQGGATNNVAFLRLLVNGTGVLQDTASPFNTSLAGLITTTTIDQSGKLLAGGNYATGSALMRYNVTGTPRNSSSGFGTNGVVYNSLVPTATINKVINAAGNGYLVAGVSNTNQFTIASYTNAGAANTDFNTTGTVREINISSSAAYDMLLNGGSLAVCGYAYSTTPVVINYNSGTGQRDASIGNNGLQQFSYLVTGTMYGITSVGTSRYGAGQGGATNNVAFLRLLVNGTGVLQDTASPFNTGLAGLVVTTTIDQSGKLLAGGNYATGSALMRYNVTGTPRNSSSGFGTNGVVYNSLVPTATINKVINAAGNGYLVAGVSSTNQFTVASYTNAGAANTTFNTTGTVTEANIGPSAAYDMLLSGETLGVCGYAYSTTPIVINYNSSTGARTSIQEFPAIGDGTMYGITLIDTSRYGAGQGVSSNTAFLRLLVNRTGMLQDTASPFDTGLAGLITTTTIDQSGKLLAGGNYATGSALMRYNTTGTPRNSSSGFGTNGVVYNSLLTTATINKVINAASNGYLAAGVSSTNQFTVASYTNAGAANTSFNTTGTVTEANIGPSAAYDMLLSGETLGVCGYAYSTTPILINYNSSTGARTSIQEFPAIGDGTMYGITAIGANRYGAGQGVSSNTAFLRLLMDGTGLLQDTASPFSESGNGIVYGECIDALGNITLCGSYNNTWMMVKYSNTAARVTSFNGDGVVLDSSLGVATAKALIQDTNGNYYVAGESTVSGTTVLTVAKYSNVGELVSSFGTNGIAQLTNYGQSRATNLVLTADNKLLVTGQVTVDGTLYAALVAYDQSGAPITTFGTNGVQVYQDLGIGIVNTVVSNQETDTATAGGQTTNQATLLQVAQTSPAAAVIASGM